MIGSHFARAIEARGWFAFGIARNSASSRIAAQPDPNIFRIDILDRDALDAAFKQIKPDLQFSIIFRIRKERINRLIIIQIANRTAEYFCVVFGKYINMRKS